MTSVCLYFQVHQPHRLRRYSVFDSDPFYFDDAKNAEVCRKVADKCYRPATLLMLDLVRKHKGRFRVSYSITGTVLEQLAQWAPDVIVIFQELAKTGCCEFLAETYHHSLAYLYSKREFDEQVAMHTRKVQQLFGMVPTVFRNTELIYNNDLAWHVSRMTNAEGKGAGKPRFLGQLCEGADRCLAGRSPNFVYTPPGGAKGRDGRAFGLLLKNYRLSDDIAFRFSNRSWAEWPLSAEKFASWINQINGNGFLCNLFMDYETFGEHQWAQTGIFQFLAALPEKVFDINPGQNHFVTPSMALKEFSPGMGGGGEYDVHEFMSWADTERDLSAWRGNAMQHNALEETFLLEAPIKAMHEQAKRDGTDEDRASAEQLLSDWRRLTTSDHFYYMCTKYFADGDVHKYFNPYESPYDSYINFMNVLDNVRGRVAGVSAVM